MYQYLARVNNWLIKRLGDNPPEGWVKLNNMPFKSLSFKDGSYSIPIATLSNNLKVRLQRKPEEINLMGYDFYSDDPELFFLLELKELLNNLKFFCKKLKQTFRLQTFNFVTLCFRVTIICRNVSLCKYRLSYTKKFYYSSLSYSV